MKSKTLLTKIVCMSLCAVSALSLLCSAAESAPLTSPTSDCPQLVVSKPDISKLFFMTHGRVKEILDGGFYIENSDKNSNLDKLIVNVFDDTYFVDATTGKKLDASAIKEGDAIYCYIGPQVTCSMPAISIGHVVLCNAPESYKVPVHITVGDIHKKHNGSIVLTDLGSDFTATVNKSTKIFDYQNDDVMLGVSDITMGSQLLLWCGADSSIWGTTATKCLVLSDLKSEIDEPSTGELPTEEPSTGELPTEEPPIAELPTDRAFSATTDGIIINGKKLDITSANFPYYNDQQNLMVPLRVICDELSVGIKWISPDQPIVLTNSSGVKAEISYDLASITFDNDEVFELLSKPQLKGGTTFVSSDTINILIDMMEGVSN